MLMTERLIPMPHILALTLKDYHRFWDKFTKIGNDACWEWKAGKCKLGYGIFKLCGSSYVASRVAYFLQYKADPGSFYVCHECNNTSCVNPSHLYLGTQFENMQQCASEGRINQAGSLNPRAILHESDIPVIRARLKRESIAAIARAYGVGHAVIWRIDHNDTWRHVA